MNVFSISLFGIITVAVTFILALIIHELGHFVFGLMGGYGFSSLSVLNVGLIREDGRLRLRWIRKTVLGQCIMYPKRVTRPELLILGGIVANTLAAAVMLPLLLNIKGIWWGVLFSFFIWNVINLFGNAFSKGCSDGATFRAVRRNEASKRAYDNLMAISAGLNAGLDYVEMKDSLFTYGKDADPTLVGELELYRLYHDGFYTQKRIRELRSKYPLYEKDYFMENEIENINSSQVVFNEDLYKKTAGMARKNRGDARVQLLYHMTLLAGQRETLEEAQNAIMKAGRHSLFLGVWKQACRELSK